MRIEIVTAELSARTAFDNIECTCTCILRVCCIACSHARLRIRPVSSMDIGGISGDNADAHMHNPITGITDKLACLSIALPVTITAGYNIPCA